MRDVVRHLGQALFGMSAIGGTVATVTSAASPHPDMRLAVVQAAATFAAFLAHRHVSMLDVRREVRSTFRDEWQAEIRVFQRVVDDAIKAHEKRSGEVK